MSNIEIVEGRTPYMRVELAKGESFVMEPKSVIKRDVGIVKAEVGVEKGDAAAKKNGVKLWQRFRSGEAFRHLKYTNETDGLREILAKPTSKMRIARFVLNEGEQLNYRQGGFFAASGEVDIGARFHQTLRKVPTGLKGIWMQAISAKHPLQVFLEMKAQIEEVEISAKNGPVIVDGRCIFAMKGDLEFVPVERSKKDLIMSDEGPVPTMITGQGSVWLEARPNAKLKTRGVLSYVGVSLRNGLLVLGLMAPLIQEIVYGDSDFSAQVRSIIPEFLL